MRSFLIAASLALAALAAPARADFVFEITPSRPAEGGAVVVLGDEVVATNLGISTVTDGVTTVVLGKYLDLQTGPFADFFVLPGPVEEFHGTPPYAYGFGPAGSTLTESRGVYHLAMAGLDSAMTGLLAPLFGVDPSARYDGTLTLDFVRDPRLAGGQVLGGSIVLVAPSVPEPASVALVASGLVVALAIRRSA